MAYIPRLCVSNRYINSKDHLVVLYHNRKYNTWRHSVDNVFCPEIYPREEAMNAAFEALEKPRQNIRATDADAQRWLFSYISIW